MNERVYIRVKAKLDYELLHNVKHFFIMIRVNREFSGQNKIVETHEIAEMLGLSTVKYIKKLREYNSIELNDGYYFKDRLDIEKFIEEVVEPHLMMQIMSVSR